ncbi:hypothetical protein CJF31_00006382 [Rutstroemia sp. NJR-2017a BVV2]|nr:hypothetical protein CJF31_00006382 [Rutstroemia sp. NJR-2017a BVV2]
MPKMFKFFFTAFLASALLSISIVSADVNAVGGFISHAGCDADTFLFVTSIEVSPAPNFFLTITPTLSGLCPNAAGQMVNSTLNLNSCLENSNANLLRHVPKLLRLYTAVAKSMLRLWQGEWWEGG